MLNPRKTLDVADTRAQLDKLAAAVQHEAEGAGADPFDTAMSAALAGVADALKAEVGALAEVEAKLGRLTRRARRAKTAE